MFLKKHEKRSTYYKVSKTFFGNLGQKNSPFYENRGEVGCNPFYTLENLVNFENAERYKQLTIFWLPWFFLFFSNSEVKVISKFCIIFVNYFPEIHLWVSLYFWRVPHKYKLARRVDLAKNFEVLIFFFLFCFCYHKLLFILNIISGPLQFRESWSWL